MKVVAVVCLFFVLMGCGSEGKKVSVKNSKGENLVSDNFSEEVMDFQGKSPVFVSIIKLKNPALLTTAKKKKGEYSLDDDLRNLILEEQESFIEKLETLSPDIRVLFTYKMVLNAVAIEAPQELVDEISKLSFDFIEPNKIFNLPRVSMLEASMIPLKNLEDKNSMTSIGVDKVHKLLEVLSESGEIVPVKGQGVKVGIIDTGIDYTHKMLGGSGSVTDYKSIDGNLPASFFPNSKIVGGRDFVGADYSTSSHIYSHHVPVPDENPIDYSGHGTHVAGTVGGVGDGVNTYSGAAPEALLYALKVFGDNGGSTSDTVVLAALEYSADPNGDLEIDDKLDVVNMSLGGNYGEEHSLYSIALKNLQAGGVVAVASAGNSGAVPNITGAPASSDAALSVAASIDYSDHNIIFSAVIAKSVKGLDLLLESVESAVTVLLGDNKVKGDVHYIGLGQGPLTENEKRLLKGKVALIDRGQVTFVQKIETAISGGAIGVLVANNEAGSPPFRMSGDFEGKLTIPAFMISKEDGDLLKKALEESVVEVDLGGEVLKSELINTITSFSSQGPRDVDAGLKPEITAPGQQILSASAGTGDRGVKINGTSMSGPHIAGIAALLVQYRNSLNAKDIKSLIMNTSKDMFDEKGEQYPISRKGAGLVQAYEALTSSVLMKTESLSLGKLSIRDKRTIRKNIRLKNISSEEQSYNLSVKGDENLEILFSENSVKLSKGEVKTVGVEIVITQPRDEVVELNSFIEVRRGERLEGRIPVLAVVNKNSAMIAKNFNREVGGGLASVEISNRSDEEGGALIFNLLGEDKRKENVSAEIYTSACDIQSSGYRVIKRDESEFFQIAVKLYNPLTGWETCDVYADLDYDKDGASDHEVKGSKPSDWPKLGEDNRFKDLPVSSLLFDSKAYEKINEDYAREVSKQEKDAPERDYLEALVGLSPMKAYRSSTVAVLELPLEVMGSKRFNLRVSTSYNNRYNINRFDQLDDDGKEWKELDLNDSVMPFSKMPEFAKVAAKKTKSFNFSSGEKNRDLVVYFPRNRYTLKAEGVDRQSQVFRASSLGGNELP